jgi:hypothetical protein
MARSSCGHGGGDDLNLLSVGLIFLPRAGGGLDGAHGGDYIDLHELVVHTVRSQIWALVVESSTATGAMSPSSLGRRG